MGASILRAIGDRFSLRIMESAVSEGKSVEEISANENIPMSTAYRRVHELTVAGLLFLERIVVTPTGKKYVIYRSTFSRFRVEFGPGTPLISCTPNAGVPDITFRVWQLARKEDADAADV